MNMNEARKIFSKLSTTQICDVAKEARVISSDIKSFIEKPKMLGKAFTVKAEGDLLPVIKSLQLATTDHVIVIDSGNSLLAMAGEILTTEAKRKNIAGIVIDGYCRDAVAIQHIGLPFFAKGICPKAGGKTKLGRFNEVIQCGQVSISADDIVMGDEDGLVVIAASELNEVLRLAEIAYGKEELTLSKLKQGVGLFDIVDFAGHYNNIAAGVDSAVEWK